MKFTVQRVVRNQRAFWAGPDRILVGRGCRAFWLSNDGNLTPQARVPTGWIERWLASCRVTRQALRLGIHNLWPLPDGSLVGVAKGVLLKCPAGNIQFRVVARLRFGNKPGFNGMCVDPAGCIYYGEYALNPGRTLPIGLYRSDDGGETYHRIHEFSAGKVRHIHYIQWDPYAQCLWMGTGDRDSECALFRSFDGGVRWETVGSGNQLWRAVGVVFTADALFWGTDAGSDTGDHQNFIVRWDRKTNRLDRVLELQGPCHGATCLGDGMLLVATGVEGGINEKDDHAHLWASSDGRHWEEIATWRKDRLPFVLQFGVVHFAHNLERSSVVHLTTRGLVGAGESHHQIAVVRSSR